MGQLAAWEGLLDRSRISVRLVGSRIVDHQDQVEGSRRSDPEEAGLGGCDTPDSRGRHTAAEAGDFCSSRPFHLAEEDKWEIWGHPEVATAAVAAHDHPVAAAGSR